MNALFQTQSIERNALLAAIDLGKETTAPTLADLVGAVDGFADMDRKKKAHLKGRLIRLAELLGNTPAAILLDMGEINARLEGVDRIAAGISPKTISNIRWTLTSTVRRSGLVPGAPMQSQNPLTPEWTALLVDQDFSIQAGLSRLAHYASRLGASPTDVDDQTIDNLMAEVAVASLRQNQGRLHRQITKKWNDLSVACPELGLRQLAVPASRRRHRRLPLEVLLVSFSEDLDRYLEWCGDTNPFAENARARLLKPNSVEALREHIHAAITNLVRDGGVKATALGSLADLVAVEHVRTILTIRHEAVKGARNYQNVQVASALVQIARDWVNVDDDHLKALKALARKVPRHAGEMTERNRKKLRAFDDPRVLGRLLGLPDELWRDVEGETNPTRSTLAKAQAAIGIKVLTLYALRLKNLSALSFEAHINLRTEKGATSTLEIPAEEVKGHKHLGFDLRPDLVAMLVYYRDYLVPQIAGRRPTDLFVNVDGISVKGFAGVRYLIQSHLKRAGIDLNPHAFRHLAGKLILDEQPGAHELVKQLLGHNDIKTTVKFYTGIDTQRAGRFHQHLLDERVKGLAARAQEARV